MFQNQSQPTASSTAHPVARPSIEMAPDRSSSSPSSQPPQPSDHRSRRASPHSTTPRRTSQSPSQYSSSAAVNGTTTPPHLSPSATSLAAAAAVNAGIQTEDRRPSMGSLRGGGGSAYGRRRSSVRHNIALNDPAMPAPGELAMSPSLRMSAQPWTGGGQTGSPTRHARAPSLGELHQELESEQEAQVNRLLSMIRQQEAHIQQLQSQPPLNTSAVEDSNPPSNANSRSHTPAITSVLPIRTGRPASVQCQHSASQHNSPSLSATPEDHTAATTSIHLPSPVIGTFRDESAFYQAETQALTRENQMLKHRIRELERQLAELAGGAAAGGHGPTLHSTLSTSRHVDGDKPMDQDAGR